METVIVKGKTNTKVLPQTLFKSEEEFEKLIFNTPEILADIFPIKRQVRGSNKTGIPDIIGHSATLHSHAKTPPHFCSPGLATPALIRAGKTSPTAGTLGKIAPKIG
jgi:hypothetical protein